MGCMFRYSLWSTYQEPRLVHLPHQTCHLICAGLARSNAVHPISTMNPAHDDVVHGRLVAAACEHRQKTDGFSEESEQQNRVWAHKLKHRSIPLLTARMRPFRAGINQCFLLGHLDRPQDVHACMYGIMHAESIIAVKLPELCNAWARSWVKAKCIKEVGPCTTEVTRQVQVCSWTDMHSAASTDLSLSIDLRHPPAKSKSCATWRLSTTAQAAYHATKAPYAATA